MANRFSSDVEQAVENRLKERGIDPKRMSDDEVEEEYGFAAGGSGWLHFEGELAGTPFALSALPLQGSRDDIHAEQRSADDELARLREEGQVAVRGVAVADERGVVHTVALGRPDESDGGFGQSLDKFMSSFWDADTLKAISEDEAAGSDGENPHG
jgi:hypothetical protein